MTTRTPLKFKICKRLATNIWLTRRLNRKQQGVITKIQTHLKFSKKRSSYSLYLHTKQLLSALYGTLHLQVLKKLFFKAKSFKSSPGQNIITLLERRLDSLIVRLRFGETFAAANQLIRHGHILINNIPITTPGTFILPGDIIQVHPKAFSLVSRNLLQFFHVQRIKQTEQKIQNMKQWMWQKPIHFEVNMKRLQAIVLFAPQQCHFSTKLEPYLVSKAMR